LKSSSNIIKCTSDNDCDLHHKNSAVESAKKAKILLSRFPIDVPISDRLAIMILFSKGFLDAQKRRHKFLHCAITKLQRNLPNTSFDIYIWTLNLTTSETIIPYWLSAEKFPKINIMEIPEETWKIPCGLISDSEWALRNRFSIDYYLMGRWRLTFSLDFAKEMVTLTIYNLMMMQC
jgi:hypothetical protein